MREQAGRIVADVAVVAEDHVGALAGGDRVGVHAAEDEVFAVARRDRIGPADLHIGRADEDPLAVGAEGGKAVVAEHDVRTGAGGDGVTAEAAEDDVVAVAHHDRVVAAAVRVQRGHAHETPAREARLAEVAEDKIRTLAGGDLVPARAAEDDVVAVATADDVACAAALIGGVDLADEAVLEGHDPHVAEHDVGARTRGDVVRAGGADDDVVAVAGLDHVAGAVIRIGRGERHAHAPLEQRSAVVAEDHVVAAERGDRVRARAADDDVVATARLDHVVVPKGRVEALGALQAALSVEGEATVIAQHDVGIGIVPAGIDRVGAQTT